MTRLRLRDLPRLLRALYANYYVNRVAQAFITLWVVITLTFALIRLLPGGPMTVLMNQMRAQARERGEAFDHDQASRIVEAHININPQEPIYIQYYEYMVSFFMGDLGTSIWLDEPVATTMANVLPWTMFVASSAILSSLIVGLVVGMLMAFYEGGKFDVSMTVYATVMTSIPYYVFALLLIFLLGYQWGWFPTQGTHDPGTTAGLNWPFIRGVLHHGFLPIFSFFLTGIGIALPMRANSISVLGQNYLRVANLRGLSDYKISLFYVGRNAILPLYTGIMISLGTIVGGSVILEEIFVYRGMGYYLWEGINRRDYPLMMGGFTLITAIVLVAITIADFTYGYVDPRVRSGAERESFGRSRSYRKVLTDFRAWLGRRFNRSERTDDQAVRRDGGTAVEHVAGRTRDGALGETVEVSWRATLFRKFDTYVYAPFMVIWRDVRGKIGITIISLYLVAGLAAYREWYPAPTSTPEDSFVSPFSTLSYPLGTDQTGQDLLGLMIHATPDMLQMILAGSVFATVMATSIGVFSGFEGGYLDRVLMTIADIVITIPGLPLLLVIAAIFEPQSPYTVGLLLTINAWGGTAREIRSQVLSLRNESFIEASRAQGIATHNMLAKDVVPNIFPYAMIKAVDAAKGVIFGSVALYYLGVLPFTNQNWGIVLNIAHGSGIPYISWDFAHWIIVPIATISLMSIGFILLAQAMDRLANPRIRARHAKTVDDATASGDGGPQ